MQQRRVVPNVWPVSQEIIGWAALAILVFTIGKQVYKQWHDETSEGVSKWLFIGQTTASVLFTIYSWMVKNWVFVVTNSLMLVNALAGMAITVRQRRRKRSR